MNRTSLDIFFAALAAWFIWKHIFRPKTLTFKSKVKDYAKHLKHIYNMNRDIYSDELNGLLFSEIQLCREIRKSKDKKSISSFLKNSQEKFKKKIPARKHESLAENLDVLLVAFSLAFTVRALFLQPFKIPTSSMQPTLHGVNLYYDNKDDSEALVDREHRVTDIEYLSKELNRPMAGEKGTLRNFLDALYYGQTYANINSPTTGTVKISKVGFPEVVKERLGVPFLQTFSKIYIEQEPVFLPIPFHKLEREYEPGSSSETHFRDYYNQGDTIFKGVSEDGDHLFVNRMIYNFRNPQRGDITVFMTEGITYDGRKLNGQFYIKRLIGLPGDRLRIKKDFKTYLVIDGQEVLLTEKHHPSFKKLYSMKGGYQGHWMARVNLNNRQIKTIPYMDMLYTLNISNTSTSGQKAISYRNDIYTLTNGKYTSEKSLNFFIMEKDGSICMTNSTEKRIFVREKNSSTWGLKSIIRNDGYEVNFEDDYEEYKLAENQYFMMGDNSAHSLDSRYWGPVSRKNIMGTAFSVFWPFSHRWGFADNYVPPDKETKIPGKF